MTFRASNPQQLRLKVQPVVCCGKLLNVNDTISKAPEEKNVKGWFSYDTV